MKLIANLSQQAPFSRLLYRAVFATACGALMLGGCSVDTDRPRSGADIRLPSKRDISVGIARAPQVCTSFAIWRMGVASDGGSLRSQALRDGDAACEQGDAANASQLYDQAAKAPFQSIAESREIAVRRASMALTRKSPVDALAVLNDFAALASRRAGPDLNDPDSDPFTEQVGYLLGVSYGSMNDIEQALSWWSRVYVSGRGSSALALRSREGVFTVLRKANDQTRARVRELWRDDAMIRTELARAQAAAINGSSSENFEVALLPNPEDFSVARLQVSPSVEAGTGNGEAIGILLPLSGKFQSLGERAKRGAELAVGVLEKPATVIAVDATESTEVVGIRVAELARGGVGSIIGPLLAEQVDIVASTVPRDVTILSLSRRSPEFTALRDPTAGAPSNFLNLGITSQSQVETILHHAKNTMGIFQLAVIGSDEALRSNSDAVRAAVQQLGMVVVIERTFAKEDIGAATNAGRDLSSSSAQAVLFVDGPSIAANVMAGVAEEQRKLIKILGLASFDNENQLRQAGLVLHGARFVAGFVRNSQRKEVQDFISVYQQRFREQPDVVAAQGFDAASLALFIRERRIAGEVVHIPPYEGLTGRIEVLSDGSVARTLSVAEFGPKGIEEIL